MLGPPNFPWAALNGDFGPELIGYMSRMAELPGAAYPFRFYVHDPWWMNSPWLDRYGREPHDIYLPLACSRVDAAGAVVGPSDIQFLTIDDSLGNMPDRCPNEVVPHILAGLDDGPDEIRSDLTNASSSHRRRMRGARWNRRSSIRWTAADE